MRKNSVYNLSLLVFLLSFNLLAQKSHATSFADRPFPDAVKDAPIIARGKAGMSYADWSKGEDGVKRIYTYYELQIEEALKGSLSGRNLIMRELGGQKDGVGLEVPGTAHFERGEDVVVFLSEKNPDGSHSVRGMMMAKYNVQRDSEGKEYLEGAGLSGSSEHQIHDDSPSQDDTSRQKWSLDALRRLILSQKESPTDPKLTAPSPTSSALPNVPGAGSHEAPLLHNPKTEEPTTFEGRDSFGKWRLFGMGAFAFLIACGLLLLTLGRRRK